VEGMQSHRLTVGTHRHRQHTQLLRCAAKLRATSCVQRVPDPIPAVRRPRESATPAASGASRRRDISRNKLLLLRVCYTSISLYTRQTTVARLSSCASRLTLLLITRELRQHSSMSQGQGHSDQASGPSTSSSSVSRQLSSTFLMPSCQACKVDDESSTHSRHLRMPDVAETSRRLDGVTAARSKLVS